MRGAFLGPFGVRAALPARPSFTQNLDPLWNVKGASWAQIAAWCYRVMFWDVTVTTPEGASVTLSMSSPYAGQDERYAAIPAYGDTINSDGGQGDDLSVIRGGFGGYYHSSDDDFELEIAVGPSLACFYWSTFPALYKDYVGALYFPLMLRYVDNTTFANLSTFGSEAVQTPLEYNWTSSLGTLTFCGFPVKLYYADKPGSPDWTGSITIAPAAASNAYWEYRQANGTNPVWDAATGAQLIAPTPPYPPH